MAFTCEHCDASYPVRKSLLNHKRLKHGDAKLFACQHCIYATTNKVHLEQHVRSQHDKVKEICEICDKEFSDKSNLNKHVRKFHPEDVKTDTNKRKATEPLENETKSMIRNVLLNSLSIAPYVIKSTPTYSKHLYTISTFEYLHILI